MNSNIIITRTDNSIDFLQNQNLPNDSFVSFSRLWSIITVLFSELIIRLDFNIRNTFSRVQLVALKLTLYFTSKNNRKTLNCVWTVRLLVKAAKYTGDPLIQVRHIFMFCESFIGCLVQEMLIGSLAVII